MGISRIKYILFVVSFAIISCRQSYYSPREIIANTDIPLKDITFEELNIENSNPRSLLAVDSMVVVFSYDKQAMIQVYDYSGKQIARLSPSGRAKNEFLSVKYAHRKSIINGDRYIYVLDPTKKEFYLYNLSASIRQGYNETPTALMEKDFFLKNVFYREDGSYFTYKSVSYDDARDLIFYPPEYTLVDTNGKKREYKIVPEVMDFPEHQAFPQSFFNEIVRMSDDGKRIASVSYYEDRMTIINLETDDCFGVRGKDFVDISQYRNSTLEVIGDTVKEGAKQVCVSDDLIFVMFDSRTIKESEILEDTPNITLRVFNWEGDFLAEFKPNIELYDLSIDFDNGILLGLDDDNRIYYAKLPDIL